MRRALSLVVVLTSSLALADEPLYLCKANEELIFGCEVKDKLVSVCSSKNLTKTTGYVQYRFGTPDNIELVYPKTEISPEGRFFLSSTGYAGGGANMIRFNNDGYEYLIFDSMVRTHFVPDEPNYPEFKAGIVTRYQGKTTSSRLCEDNDASIRAVAFEVFERENFDHAIIP